MFRRWRSQCPHKEPTSLSDDYAFDHDLPLKKYLALLDSAEAVRFSIATLGIMAKPLVDGGYTSEQSYTDIVKELKHARASFRERYESRAEK